MDRPTCNILEPKQKLFICKGQMGRISAFSLSPLRLYSQIYQFISIILRVSVEMTTKNSETFPY